MWHLVRVPQMFAPYTLLSSVEKELHHATEEGGKCLSHGAAPYSTCLLGPMAGGQKALSIQLYAQEMSMNSNAPKQLKL